MCTWHWTVFLTTLSKDSNARTIGSETFDAFFLFLSRSIKARDVIFGWVSRPLAKLEASDV